MSETSGKGELSTLQGEAVPMIGVTTIDGLPVLRWRRHFIEYGQRQRLETQIHPEMPGVTIVRAYWAGDPNIFEPSQPSYTPTLEEAKVDDSPFIFLISKGDKIIVTSRMNNEKPSEVHIRKPRYMTEDMPDELEVEMLDFPESTNEEELVELHRVRCAEEKSVNMDRPIPESDVNGIYRYMTHD
jgi:hypothetical protein